MISSLSMNVLKELVEKLHFNKALYEAYENTIFNWPMVWSLKVKTLLRKVCSLAYCLVHMPCLFGEEIMGSV